MWGLFSVSLMEIELLRVFLKRFCAVSDFGRGHRSGKIIVSCKFVLLIQLQCRMFRSNQIFAESINHC